MNINEANIKKVISNAFNILPEHIENIKCDDDLRSMGLDSVSSIELVIRLEEEWDISITDEDLAIKNISTINNIIQLLEKYVSEKSV